jgi:ABC-type multidrug transport system fused ATPase/permease subunit
MSKLKRSFKVSLTAKSFQLLSHREKSLFPIILILQLIMALLDLLGVLLFGIVATLAINGVSAKSYGARTQQVLDFFSLENQDFQFQVAMLSCVAALILSAKTLLSMTFLRKSLFFLSRSSARISGRLLNRVLPGNLLTIQKSGNQELLYGLTIGVDAIAIGVLGTWISICSDVLLLIILGIGLAFVSPIMTILSFSLFGAVGIILYLLLFVRAKGLGTSNAEKSIKANRKFLEVLSTLREITVKNRREYYAGEIQKIWEQQALAKAELAFLPSISKFVLEISIVVGTMIIAFVQFVIGDSVQSVGILSIFLLASTRVAPAVMRIQQSLLQLKANLGTAERTFQIMDDFQSESFASATNECIDVRDTFVGDISCVKISFNYPLSTRRALSDVSISCRQRTLTAIVGPSGGGKSTLVDVLLGILNPESGSVFISGTNPQEAIRKFPGQIGYVPQNSSIVSGSIRNNLSLGYPPENFSENEYWEALRQARLDDFVSNLPNKLEYEVGDNGSLLSGGQRQRLGIARAILTQPKLLILDEATSALDGQTEADLSDTILGMKKDMTIIVIAHRLSTVRLADQVIYISDGSVIASGSFAEVRMRVPDFDKQAQLMGL